MILIARKTVAANIKNFGIPPHRDINDHFISSRNNYLKYKDRIGKKPILMNIEKIKSFDIDWPEDFKIAEKIYESIF